MSQFWTTLRSTFFLSFTPQLAGKPQSSVRLLPGQEPRASSGRGQVLSPACSCLQGHSLNSSWVWKPLVLLLRLQTPRPAEEASETRGSQREEHPAVALSHRTFEQEQIDTARQQRGGERLPTGKESRNGTAISLYICVTIFSLLWEYKRKQFQFCIQRPM